MSATRLGFIDPNPRDEDVNAAHAYIREIHDGRHATIPTRVSRGIEWLQSSGINLDRINIDALDISSGYRCALGQLFGDYSNGLTFVMKSSLLHRYARQYDMGFERHWAEAHGFVGYAYRRGDEYDALTREWKRQLKALRKNAPASRLRPAPAESRTRSHIRRDESVTRTGIRGWIGRWLRRRTNA